MFVEFVIKLLLDLIYYKSKLSKYQVSMKFYQAGILKNKCFLGIHVSPISWRKITLQNNFYCVKFIKMYYKRAF